MHVYARLMDATSNGSEPSKTSLARGSSAAGMVSATAHADTAHESPSGPHASSLQPHACGRVNGRIQWPMQAEPIHAHVMRNDWDMHGKCGAHRQTSYLRSQTPSRVASLLSESSPSGSHRDRADASELGEDATAGGNALLCAGSETRATTGTPLPAPAVPLCNCCIYRRPRLAVRPRAGAVRWAAAVHCARRVSRREFAASAYDTTLLGFDGSTNPYCGQEGVRYIVQQISFGLSGLDLGL